MIEGERALDRQTVEVWCVCPEPIDDEALIERYHGLLSAEESIQQKRFHFARDRHQYLVTRALVRSVLSRYAPVDPPAWTFQVNQYDCPSILEPAAFAGLRFNLSHTAGLIVCAVAQDRDLGIDVENLNRKGQTVEIADRFFAPFEARALRALPTGLQRRRFFEYWTLKEAYIKARGMGISLPLEEFWYDLDAGDAIRIDFGPGIRDDASDWQFLQREMGAEHLLALAIRRGADPELQIRFQNIVPLVD